LDLLGLLSYDILDRLINYIPDWLSSQAMTAPIPDEFLDLMAEKFRMLADSTRLAILRALMEGEKNVTQVVEETGRNQANVSKHLKMLAEAGLVGRRKEGLQVFYRLDDPLVEKLCKLVCETIVQEAREEVEQKRKLLQGWGAKEP
jgi:DNA-binding transcriptional ArsR family regulator